MFENCVARPNGSTTCTKVMLLKLLVSSTFWGKCQQPNCLTHVSSFLVWGRGSCKTSGVCNIICGHVATPKFLATFPGAAMTKEEETKKKTKKMN